MQLSRSQEVLYRAFVATQKQNYLADPQLKQLQERVQKIVEYSSFPLTEDHPDIKLIRDMQVFVRDTRYPALNKAPVELIPCLPRQLSLEQIDKRLRLFTDYMEYRLDNLYQWDCMVRHFLAEYWRTGIYYHFEASDMQDFDGWLYLNGHHDLVELIVIF